MTSKKSNSKSNGNGKRRIPCSLRQNPGMTTKKGKGKDNSKGEGKNNSKGKSNSKGKDDGSGKAGIWVGGYNTGRLRGSGGGVPMSRGLHDPEPGLGW
jgi:hypothetical protein